MTMNTAALKTWIKNLYTSHPVIASDMDGHEAKPDEKYWRRFSKNRINAHNDDEYEWILEIEDDMGQAPTVPLVGCVVRQFLHTQADAVVGIVTDPTDTTIVGWAFTID